MKFKIKSSIAVVSSVLLTLSHVASVHAADQASNVAVHSLDELQDAVSKARPGDLILVAAGTYEAGACTLSAKGTKAQPIRIQAETTGDAHLRGPITLKGSHLTLAGFFFSGKGTVTISGQSIRMTRCSMKNVEGGKWVRGQLGSREIEIDHCRFAQKEENRRMSRNCQLIQLYVTNSKERHHIHHNHFHDIPRGATGNGFETIQLITHRNPFDPPPGHCETVIENNLFERCNGEAEIISVKSNGNIIRRNTFRACRGSIVLRHGDDNVVASNVLFADGETGSGGVRLQGTGQIVANNYFHGLNFGVAMMDGTPDKLYMRVERAQVLFNSFVDCRTALKVGINHSKHPNGTVPRECWIAGNAILNTGDESAACKAVELVQNDQPEAWIWSDNASSVALGIDSLEGLTQADPHFRLLENGVAVPTQKTPVAQFPHAASRRISTDLLETPRGEQSTIGALHFQIANTSSGPLTEAQVGPDAYAPAATSE